MDHVEICDHLGSYVSISAHLGSSRISHRIIWEHLQINLGSLGATIWKDKLEDMQLEGFLGGCSQLMRKRYSAIVCKTFTKIAVALFVFEGKYHQVLYMI